MQGIRLELDSSIFNGKFGTVLDSGTTYAYLPDRAFEAFRDAVRFSVIFLNRGFVIYVVCSTRYYCFFNV